MFLGCDLACDRDLEYYYSMFSFVVSRHLQTAIVSGSRGLFIAKNIMETTMLSVPHITQNDPLLSAILARCEAVLNAAELLKQNEVFSFFSIFSSGFYFIFLSDYFSVSRDFKITQRSVLSFFSHHS